MEEGAVWACDGFEEPAGVWEDDVAEPPFGLVVPVEVEFWVVLCAGAVFAEGVDVDDVEFGWVCVGGVVAEFAGSVAGD